ncbi:hypothetical protein L4D77_24580 [Photobacterium frigidiphilum]|uniref:hypothetical protein n=2 Tax=Photobacterium TaxID=657 RepID=UPI003D11C2E6
MKSLAVVFLIFVPSLFRSIFLHVKSITTRYYDDVLLFTGRSDMNKNEFFLAYPSAPPKKAARDAAYRQRQGRARRQIETRRDARSFGLSLADINAGED